jgi:hypothetical protein
MRVCGNGDRGRAGGYTMLKLLAVISIGFGALALLIWLSTGFPKLAVPVQAAVKPDDMRPISVSIAGRVFAIPYSYLTPRPDLTKVKAENAWDSFGLAFWMPNGQPVGQDMISVQGFALDAVSFRGPVDGLHIVIVRGVSSATAKYARPDPEPQLRNSLGDGVSVPFEKTEIDDKTTIFRQKNLGSDKSYEIYGRPGSDRKYLIDCEPSDVPYPSCQGDVRLYDYDLIVRVQYPVQRDMDIAAITAKLEELMASWSSPAK